MEKYSALDPSKFKIKRIDKNPDYSTEHIFDLEVVLPAGIKMKASGSVDTLSFKRLDPNSLDKYQWGVHYVLDSDRMGGIANENGQKEDSKDVVLKSLKGIESELRRMGFK